MTDKKLTDEEIIKRLEYMRKNADEGYMAHLENGGEVDKNEEEYIDILCGTLDLINHQNAEIERLQKEVNLVSIQFQDLQERAEEYRLKIENLQNVISNQQIEISAKIEKQIKAEAIKAFAEKLKNKCYEDFQETYEMLSPYVTDDDIDNLLREMVGEEE